MMISSDLANKLSIKKNDILKLIVLHEKKNHFDENIQCFSFKIKDIFKSNTILNRNIGYIPLKFFKKFFHAENNINSIELYVSDPFNIKNIIVDAARQIGIPFFIYTWIDSYKNIYNDVKQMKTIIYLILLLLVIMSSFSITSVSIMTISQKTKEIAILRSMGANNYLIQKIFLYYGLRSIMIGTLIGLFIGISIILNFETIILFLNQHFKDNILLNNIYYDNFLLLELNLLDVIIIFSSTITIGVLANWYPAYYASQINPSKILKEY